MSYNPKNLTPTTTDETIFRSAYSPRLRVSISFPENSEYTKQEFKEEADINILMSKYIATGILPNMNESAPQYLDVTGIEFQESMQFVAGAKSLFMEMPSAIRNRFQNDPAQFLDFCSNDKNRDEMAEMGLLRPKSEWTLPPAAVVSPEPITAAPVPTPKPTPQPTSAPTESA